MTRTQVVPGQLDLFDLLPEEPKPEGPCLYRSEARGMLARLREFEAWKIEYGNFGCISRSHGWHGIAFGKSPEDMQLDRCEPLTLTADLRRWRDTDPISPCGHDGPYLHRAVCRGRGCDWEGPEREHENPAAEDGLDHAWPGWRNLPTVPEVPYVGSGTSKSDKKIIAAWVAKVTAVYPAGWLEAGGPICTRRDPPGNRHVPARTPYGGYDVAVPTDPGTEEE